MASASDVVEKNPNTVQGDHRRGEYWPLGEGNLAHERDRYYVSAVYMLPSQPGRYM